MASTAPLTRAGVDHVALLADERRRRILGILAECERIPIGDLASAVADLETDQSDPVTVAADVRHVHVPTLAAAGALETDDGTVVRSESPLYDSPLVDVEADSTVFEALADSRRQSVLSMLASVDGAASLDSLAWRVATETADASPADVPERQREAVAVSLHHRHLPKLADAGAVTYDPEAGEASLAESVPDLVAAALASGFDSEYATPQFDLPS